MNDLIFSKLQQLLAAGRQERETDFLSSASWNNIVSIRRQVLKYFKYLLWLKREHGRGEVASDHLDSVFFCSILHFILDHPEVENSRVHEKSKTKNWGQRKGVSMWKLKPYEWSVLISRAQFEQFYDLWNVTLIIMSKTKFLSCFHFLHFSGCL